MIHNCHSNTWPAHKGVPKEISRSICGHGGTRLTRCSMKTKREIKRVHTKRSRHFLKRNLEW